MQPNFVIILLKIMEKQIDHHGWAKHQLQAQLNSKICGLCRWMLGFVLILGALTINCN